MMMMMRMSVLFPNGWLSKGPNLQNHGSIVSQRPFVQLSGKKDERLHGSAPSVPLSHLPGWSTQHTIPNCTRPYQTKPYPLPSHHTRMDHPPYSNPPHTVLNHNQAESTKIDQSDHTWIDWGIDPSTFLRNRPPLHFVFIPLKGRPPHVISAFSLFPSPPWTNLFPLCLNENIW